MKQMIQQEVNVSPNIKLEIISSASLQKGQIITINPLGLYGNYISERESAKPGSALDGFTYFGSIPYEIEQTNNDGTINFAEKQVVVNDFIIPSRNQDGSDHKGRHFQIWFDPVRKNYFIKDLGIGFGVFKKMDTGPAPLKDNMLMNVGEAYIVVNLYPEGAEQEGKPYETLKLKMFGGPNNGEVYEFNIPEMEQKQELLIGRTPECDVKINDKLLSKIQCHIKVVNSNDGQNVDQQSLGQNCLQWTLFDGYRNKQSTNGTWLYINTDTLLKNGDIFKANQSIF